MRYIARRAKRSLASRLRFKAYRRQKNREESGLGQAELRSLHQFQHQPVPYFKVKAPAVLSFVRNPEGVSLFISQLGDCFEKHKPAWVVLHDVKEIDYDGITVLLSVMIRFKAKKIKFNGDFPENSEARRIITESGFFDHLLKSEFSDRDSYELTSKSSIFTHAMKNVDSELGAKLIDAASTTVWGHKRRCTGVQRSLIELMQNTNNHAAEMGEEEKHWWLSVKHVANKKLVAFSFVDYGVGVFYSLKNKPRDNKFYGVLERLFERFRYGDNSDVLKLIFQGELHKTASGQPFRGKGLPGVYEALQKNKISNLAMITNNVFFNSATGEYRILQNEFQGTFVYWELNPANLSLPYEN